MDYFLIALVSLVASGLTLFSGFGLGTLLMPVFALFMPVEIAVAMTAIVHLLNNLFKLILTGKNAHWITILKFGIPAVIMAFVGAQLLIILSELPPVTSYILGNTRYYITPFKLIIAFLMIIFSLYELIPVLNKKTFSSKYLIPGGALSGFFGGLSGHQGAFRSAFLVRTGLSKEVYIATGVIIASFVDITRLSIYASAMTEHINTINLGLLITAILAAFAGAFIGNKLVKKITMRTIQMIVSVMLFAIAILLSIGII